MRILLSCLQSQKVHAIPAYAFWREYFVRGCGEAGIECVETPDVDWAEGLVHRPGPHLDSWRERTWQRVVDHAKKEHLREPIDCFLGYLYPKQVESAAISALQKLGIPCVNFFCDNVREFQSVPVEYGPFDLHWVPEYEALQMYRDAGLATLHAPMPCWVPQHLRQAPPIESEPPTFIGSADPLRRQLLGQALEQGAQFVVRGPGWDSAPSNQYVQSPPRSLGRVLMNQVDLVQRQGLVALWRKLEGRLAPVELPAIPASAVQPPAWGDEYARITREARVTLGVNRVPTARASIRRPLTYSRLRDIEAPMVGACYLTEWTEGLEHLYELGAEVETFKDSQELCSKLRDLASDKERRALMRARSQRRALTEHSVAHTLRKIYRQLNLRFVTNSTYSIK